MPFVCADKVNPLCIDVDIGYCMSGKIFSELELYVPFEAQETYFKPSSTFPNHIDRLLDHNNLVDVRIAIIENKYGASVTFDGDSREYRRLQKLAERNVTFLSDVANQKNRLSFLIMT